MTNLYFPYIGADASANAASVAAHVLATLAPNASRQNVVVHNQSNETIQVVLDDLTDGSTAGTPTILELIAAASDGESGGVFSFTQSGILHKGRIRIASSAADSQVAVREY